MAPQSLKHNGTDTHMNSVTRAAHTGPEQIQPDGVPATRGGSGLGVPCLTKKLSAKEKLVFSDGVLLGILTRLQSRPRNNWPTQNEWLFL